MFEANYLIHFVFANEKDTYYCGNSLKMDLEQRLWWELHQAGYRTVYYLHRNNQDFEIRHYGDPEVELPVSGLLFGGPTTTPAEKGLRLGIRKWMENEAAVVSSLSEFCRVMDNEYRYGSTWRELCEIEKKHNGVLVLTVTPEEEALLEKSSFLADYRSRTREMDFLEATEENEGTARIRARRKRQGNCVFWNHFPEKELIHFLKHVILNDPGKVADYGGIQEMAAYLSMVLDQEAVLKDRIFAGREIGGYNDLFRILEERGNWEKLSFNCRSTSLKQFYNNYQIPESWRRSSVPISEGTQMTADIKEAIRGMDKEDCNPLIRAYVSGFLLQLHREERDKDWESCERVLYAIRFCMEWIHVGRDSEEEAAIIAIIHQMQEYIKLSENYYMEAKSLAMIQVKDEHGVAARTRQQLVVKHGISEKFLDRYEDLLISSMLSLTIQRSAADIRRIAESIGELTEEVANSRTEETSDMPEELAAAASWKDEVQETAELQGNDGSVLPEEESQEKTGEDEYDYSITPEMYSIML